MPGPVDPARLLVAELAAGAFDGVAGLIRPDWEDGLTVRPSLAQVTASEPTSSSKPRRPAKIGSTPMPRTTLASRILQADPVIAFEGRAGAHRAPRAARRDCRFSASRRASPPVAPLSACSTSGRRGDFGEFARVGGPDIGKRGELAVGRAPEPKLVGGRCAAPKPGLDRLKVDRPRCAGRRRQRHRIDTCRPWSGARTVMSRPRTTSRSASSSRSGSFISQCDRRRSRSRCGPPPS